MSEEKQIFSSPYTAKTIDQIPTPVLKFLIVLGPLIRQLTHLTQVLTWKSSNKRESIVLLLVWNLFCLWTKPALSLLPCVLLYFSFNNWFQTQIIKTRQEQIKTKIQKEIQKTIHDDDNDSDEQQDRIETLKEQERELKISRKIRPQGQVLLDDTLNDIAIINECVEQLIEQWKPVLSIDRVGLVSGFLYVWPIWILACWLLGPHVVFACLGTLVITISSPQFHLIWTTILRNRFIQYITHSLWSYGVAFITMALSFKFSFKFWSSHAKKVSKLQVEQSKKPQAGMVFQFEIYEHERWWLGAKWTKNMMPNEREAWTDNKLRPIKSKKAIELPANWVFIDKEWWVDMTNQDKIDNYGWEYGNNSWQQFSNQPNMQTFTRRRKWCRKARLNKV